MLALPLRVDSTEANVNEFQARYKLFYPTKTNKLGVFFPIRSVTR